MAKSETTTVKKSKGKKRKHGNAETEDEVANKSVIVEHNTQDEPMQTECDEQIITKRSKKRKNKDKGAISEKRIKSSQNSADRQSDNEEADDLLEPSLEELKESEKVVNNLAIVSGRQKKKQYRQKIVENKKDQSIEKEKQRNTEYLTKWKHSPNNWKFEKLRQISIQRTIFDSDKMNADVWPIALEYLAGSKGSAKAKILKLANDVIEDVDKLCEESKTESEKQAILSSIKYQRARDLLQIFK